MEIMNTICAASTGSLEETRTLLAGLIGLRSHRELEERPHFIDESGRFGIAVPGEATGETFHRDPEADIAVVFQGRISNATRLVGSLQGEGEPPSGGSAELVGRLFRRFGPDCVEKLHGHYNFIVWDGKNDRLVACRDQIGTTPLFYTTGERDARAVASRAEALVGAGIAGPSMDHEAIFYFLHDKAFTSSETPFTGVRGLRAGERLIIDRTGHRTERYYRMPIRKLPMNEGEAIDRADELLKELLEEYTGDLSDIGLLLSGGVDSMLLLSSLRSVTDKPLHTFSISVGAGGKDIEYAKRAADHFGTKHTELVIDEVFFRDHLLDVIGRYPTPAVGGWHVYMGTLAAGKQGVRSIFCGFGGELVFGIPSNLATMARLHSFLRSPDPGTPLGGRLIAMADMLSRYLGRSIPRARLLGQYSDILSGKARWYGSKLDGNHLPDLLVADIANPLRVREKYLNDYADSGSDDLIDMLTYSRMRNFEGNKVLGKSNEIARLNGVELINPFLDRRMVEFGFSIPHELKSIGGQYRHIEVSLAARYHDFKRQKSAFIAPFGEWLRTGLPDRAKLAFDPDVVAARGIFRPERLTALWNEYLSGESDLAWADLFSMISLEMWLRDVCGL